MSALDQVDGEVNKAGCERPLNQPQKPLSPLWRGARIRSYQLRNTLGSMARDGQQFRERSIGGLRRAQPAFPPLIVVGGVEPLRQGEQTSYLARHRRLTPSDRFDGLPVRQHGIELPEDRDNHIMQVRADPVGAQEPGHCGAETFRVCASKVFEDLPGLGATEQVLT
ncbi:hypothetical protein ACFYNY_23815 [Streptomyces sp. NPDC006530]|uniref:hypothetical protein n=1 Tax=Streptomyces sp. NPDC006530 TaxID=3364750 RepID=UPI0036919981